MSDEELLQWVAGAPALVDPYLLLALDGFVDAGSVGATAGMFLRHRWRTELAATLDGDAFIDYRARRPRAVIDNGVLNRVEMPALELFAGTVDGADHDVLLLLGPEPDMRWGAFFRTVEQLCQATGVAGVITLGAYPAAMPHTRPVRIMRAVNAAGTSLIPGAEDVAGYSGPVGAAMALQAHLNEIGVPSVGLWAEVPHYISGSPNPAGALAMVRVLAEAFGVIVDTTELEAAAILHREQVDEAVAEHAEAAEMIAAFERHLDEGEEHEQIPSGEDIAAEIERFLRTQGE